MNPKAPIKSCPHCGSEEGFYSKFSVSGSSVYRHNYDGSEAENSSMYDHINHRTSKYAYCQSCDKRLFKMSEFK